MIKEYCDICSKEAETNKYYLPVMEDLCKRQIR